MFFPQNDFMGVLELLPGIAADFMGVLELLELF